MLVAYIKMAKYVSSQKLQIRSNPDNATDNNMKNKASVI